MRRPTLPAVIALLLIGALVAPAGAAAAGPSNGETVTGVLQAYYVDDFDSRGDDDTLHYDLRTASGTIPVRFPGRGPVRLVGSKVTLTGTLRGGALRVASSSPGADLRVRAAAGHVDADPDALTFAVVLMNFTDIPTQPWTKSTVQTAIAGGSSSMKAFFEEESKGDVSVSASVYGWYTIPATSSGCDWQDLGNARLGRRDRCRCRPHGVHQRDVHLALHEQLRVRGRRLRARPLHVSQRDDQHAGHGPRGRPQPGARARERAHLHGRRDAGHDRREQRLLDAGLRRSVLRDGQRRAAPRPRLAAGRARLAVRLAEGGGIAGAHLHDRAVLRIGDGQARPDPARRRQLLRPRPADAARGLRLVHRGLARRERRHGPPGLGLGQPDLVASRHGAARHDAGDRRPSTTRRCSWARR